MNVFKCWNLRIYDITIFLTSCVSSHWLWMERRGCLLLAVFNSPVVFFCHVLHHWLRLDSILHVHCPAISWFTDLPCLTLHCTNESPSTCLIGLFLLIHWLNTSWFHLHPTILCTIFFFLYIEKIQSVLFMYRQYAK